MFVYDTKEICEMNTRKSNEKTYELKYTGWLAESESTPIYLHYGTQNWTEVSEAKMRKLKGCYKTEITVPAYTSISFCFRDTNGNWDNNSGNDYWYTPSIGETYSCVEINETTTTTTTPKTCKTTTKCASTTGTRTTKTTTGRTTAGTSTKTRKTTNSGRTSV